MSNENLQDVPAHSIYVNGYESFDLAAVMQRVRGERQINLITLNQRDTRFDIGRGGGVQCVVAAVVHNYLRGPADGLIREPVHANGSVIPNEVPQLLDILYSSMDANLLEQAPVVRDVNNNARLEHNGAYLEAADDGLVLGRSGEEPRLIWES